MQKLLRCAVVPIVFVLGSASWAAAGDLKLAIGGGRATLIAQDVPLRQILEEWARVGHTTIINGDKLTGPALTLQLVDRPEREVLEVVLRSASGYIAAARATVLAGASQFDRVMILPTSRGPVGVGAAPPEPFRRVVNMPQPMPADTDDPIEPSMINNQPVGNLPNMPAQSTPGFQNVPNPPGQAPPGQPQPILTAPRPGMLPAPPQGPPNPYGPVPQPQILRPPGGPGGAGGSR
jgi:hypothetical protein